MMASAAAKPTKNQLRRAKKKAQKTQVVNHYSARNRTRFKFEQETAGHTPEPTQDAVPTKEDSKINSNGAEKATGKVPSSFTPSAEPLVMDEDNPLFDMYKDIMGKFEEADKEDPAL